MNVVENGFLFGLHVLFAMLPVEVGDDWGGDQQATQQGEIEATTVAILQLTRRELLGNRYDVVVVGFGFGGGGGGGGGRRRRGRRWCRGRRLSCKTTTNSDSSRQARQRRSRERTGEEGERHVGSRLSAEQSK